MKQVFNKLVRDKIPEKIESNGEKAYTRILSEEEYKMELEKKLNEEYQEVLSSSGKLSRSSYLPYTCLYNLEFLLLLDNLLAELSSIVLFSLLSNSILTPHILIYIIT